MEDEAVAWGQEARELERRLLEAAQALLAHRGAGSVLVAFPGRLPACCVAVGELGRLREMLRPADADA